MLAKEIDGTAFRLMGTGVSALRPGSLADDTDMLDRRSAHAERAIDDLRKKFGQAAVIRGIAYDGPEKAGDTAAIARSAEAKASIRQQFLDCLVAEPVIGRACARPVGAQ